MRVKCLLCDNVVTEPSKAEVPFKNIALKGWTTYCLHGNDLCPSCEKKFIASVHELYLKIQDSLSDTDSMVKQYTKGMSMKDVISKHPDGDFEKLFDKLLKDSLCIRDDFGLLVVKVGWRFAYSRLDVVRLSSIMGLTIKDIVEILLREIPKCEWRWDLDCCNKVGIENCAARISLGPLNGYNSKSTAANNDDAGYEQLTFKFD